MDSKIEKIGKVLGLSYLLVDEEIGRYFRLLEGSKCQ